MIAALLICYSAKSGGSEYKPLACGVNETLLITASVLSAVKVRVGFLFAPWYLYRISACS